MSSEKEISILWPVLARFQLFPLKPLVLTEIGKKEVATQLLLEQHTHFSCLKYFTLAYAYSSWCFQLQLANNLLLKQKSHNSVICIALTLNLMDGSLENMPALLEGPVGVFCSVCPVSLFLLPELRQTFPGLLRCALRTGADYSLLE